MSDVGRADDPLHLLDTDHWQWTLFPNQCTPGRVQFTLLRRCEGSLAALTETEWADLRACLQRFEATSNDLFAPDRFNYKQLGNQMRQTHVHGIPRYGAPINVEGITVRDERWGDDPFPEPENPFTHAQVAIIAQKMRSALTGG